MIVANYHRSAEDGAIEVTILNDAEKTAIILSDADFDRINADYVRFMTPIWEERSRLKKEQEQAERAAAYEAGQRVVEISGVKARVQYRVKADFSTDYGRITGMWMDGFDREAAPFFISFDTWGHNRPYCIKGPVKYSEKRFGGEAYVRREEVLGAKGGSLRFGTAEAAFKRAVELGLHKVEAKAE